MARPRKTSAVLADLAECRAAMHRLLLATIKREGLVGARDLAAAAIVKGYEKAIAAEEEKEKDLAEQLRQYLLVHPPEGKKSIDLEYGVIGTRTSPAALKPLNKAWKWATILVALKEKFGARFLHTPEPTVDKEAVKKEIAEDELKQYGLKLESEEEFYIDLNRSKTEAPPWD